MNDITQETLGEFIEYYLQSNSISAAQLAHKMEVPESSIAKFRNHGINEKYSGRPVGDPSLRFMYRLHKVTRVGIASLCRLVYPDIDAPPTYIWLAANLISDLPDEERKIALSMLEGAVANSSKRNKK